MKLFVSKKRSTQNRQEIRNVTELNMKEKLGKKCESRMDDLGRQILIRLSNIIYLVVAEGKYNLNCYKNLVRDVLGSSKDSQEKDERQSAFFKIV